MIPVINSHVVASSALAARSYNEIMMMVAHVLREVSRLSDGVVSDTEVLQQSRCL